MQYEYLGCTDIDSPNEARTKLTPNYTSSLLPLLTHIDFPNESTKKKDVMNEILRMVVTFLFREKKINMTSTPCSDFFEVDVLGH